MRWSCSGRACSRRRSALRQKAVELERASRYKSEFLANMSHELRTPLNSTLILAKLLGDNEDGNLAAEQVKYAQSISSAGNDLLALINDILDLSKIEAGKIDLEMEPIAISTLVARSSAASSRSRPSGSSTSRVTVEPGAPDMIETDRQRLQQILSNLLSNAVKFTERGGVRLIVRRESAQRLAFTVEDTGIGIADEISTRSSSRRFDRPMAATNRKFGGTGLGLSISREFAALLGGELGCAARRDKAAPSPCCSRFAPMARRIAAVRRGSRRRRPWRPRRAAISRTIATSIDDSRRMCSIVEDDPPSRKSCAISRASSASNASSRDTADDALTARATLPSASRRARHRPSRSLGPHRARAAEARSRDPPCADPCRLGA